MSEILSVCPGAERALGKLGVSLGESGGFVRGKSEFALRKVQGAENA